MGTRINVLFKHDLADNRDRDVILNRLAPTLPAAIAVKDFWTQADPGPPHDEALTWRVEPETRVTSGTARFTAPGSIFLTIMGHVASIRTGGRWRGFLSIAPLRRAHVTALRQIALALGGNTLAYFPDSCEIDDLSLAGRSFEDCTRQLRTMWGPPLEDLDNLDAIDIDGPDVFTTWIFESIEPWVRSRES